MVGGTSPAWSAHYNAQLRDHIFADLGDGDADLLDGELLAVLFRRRVVRRVARATGFEPCHGLFRSRQGAGLLVAGWLDRYVCHGHVTPTQMPGLLPLRGGAPVNRDGGWHFPERATNRPSIGNTCNRGWHWLSERRENLHWQQLQPRAEPVRCSIATLPQEPFGLI